MVRIVRSVYIDQDVFKELRARGLSVTKLFNAWLRVQFAEGSLTSVAAVAPPPKLNASGLKDYEDIKEHMKKLIAAHSTPETFISNYELRAVYFDMCRVVALEQHLSEDVLTSWITRFDEIIK
jgi:hypothetical protein